MKRKEMIERMLRRLGVPAHLNGYEYLVDAVSLMYEDDTYKSAMTKRLYPDIAKKNKTTPSRVERAIRHAIEVGIPRADKEYLEEVFSFSYSESKGKPTNSEYIACLSRELALKLDE